MTETYKGVTRTYRQSWRFWWRVARMYRWKPFTVGTVSVHAQNAYANRERARDPLPGRMQGPRRALP